MSYFFNLRRSVVILFLLENFIKGALKNFLSINGKTLISYRVVQFQYSFIRMNILTGHNEHILLNLYFLAMLLRIQFQQFCCFF